ncbi:MAG: vWA domain-containing protein [Thermoguttaceae bacterium]
MSRVPYSQEISRQNKACFLFLLDQSFSMEEPLGNSANRKCDELVAAINGWLQNMAIRASGDQGIRDWMDIGVFGYRTDPQANPIIESTLQGALAGRMLVSITEIGMSPARIDTRMQYIPDEATGQMLELPLETPVWVDPKAEGGTPMCHMLYHTHQILTEWIGHHPYSFPPIVVHITDGESQDGDPLPYAEAVRNLATEDGNVMLFNCHLSMTAADPFMFPSTEHGLPDELARVLFHMSSPLPDPFYRHGIAEGFPLQPGARGMAFNADMVCLIQFLNMGTQAAAGLR